MPCEVSGQFRRALKGVSQAHGTVDSVAIGIADARVGPMNRGLVLRPVFHTVVKLVFGPAVLVCAYVRPQVVYEVCSGENNGLVPVRYSTPNGGTGSPPCPFFQQGARTQRETIGTLKGIGSGWVCWRRWESQDLFAGSPGRRRVLRDRYVRLFIVPDSQAGEVQLTSRRHGLRRNKAKDQIGTANVCPGLRACFRCR
jgi:hypothetical protein